jgi:ABC-2 type transport system permease protein
VFALVPFSWGARAAVHAGRGEALPFLGWAGASTLALAATLGVSVVLAQRLYRGEIDLGEASARGAARARMRLPGAVGALVEKDLRVAWRDPRLKALVFTGVIGPLVLLLVLWQGSPTALRPGLLLAVASFSGLGALGANAFALERQGLGLLFGFPVDRFLVLVGKNLGVIALRLPALLAVSAATLLIVGPAFVPAVAVVVLLTQILAAAADNDLSTLFPVPVAAAGRDPNAPVSGTRGLGAAAMVLVATAATLLVSAPFVFLAWLPHLLGERWLWALTLPLALAGAVGVYFMATSGAARLLARREPDLVARMAGED